jgi:hypothetical protein
MHINVYGQDVKPDVRAARKVDSSGATQRGVELHLVNGDVITFWLDPNVILAGVFKAMGDQARLLREEAER